MKRRAGAADVAIGGKVRLARRQAKLSQEELAERLGVSFQQVQKYEKGSNRISALQLLAISRVLDQPLRFFLPLDAESDETDQDLAKLLADRDVAKLLSAFARIEAPELRRRIVALVVAMTRDVS